jgi:hypothetical protein
MDVQARPTLGRTWVAVGICAFAYLYVFPYQPQINNPNENVRFYMTAALVEEGSYAIDSQRARWGWVNDAAVNGGHVYSVKAPGTSLLGVPGYAAYRYGVKQLGRGFDRTEALWVCRFTASILPTLIWLFFFYRWLGKRTRHPLLRDCAFLSVALGSLLYGYGLLFVSHSLSAAAGFGAFMILYDERRAPPDRQRLGSPFLAGLLTASVTLFEYPGLICSALLAIYGLSVLRPARRLLGFAAGGLIPALAMAHFQWRAFGGPFTPGHLMVENAAFRAAHHRGFFGAEGPSWQALYGLTLDPAAGLLPLTPILIFALLGFAILLAGREQRNEALITLGIATGTLLAICSMNNWRGGWTIGPRYLAVTVPFLAWAALRGLGLIARRFPRIAYTLALGCTALALPASGLPSAYYPHLPPEITRPLPQLFQVLIRHDYAPYNAGSWFGLYGTGSMLPLLAAGVFALWWALGSVHGAANRLKICAAATVIALGLSWPLLARPAQEPGVPGAVAFITSRWSPAGHDQAAQITEQLKASRNSDPELRRRLSEVLRQEGRMRQR